MDGRENSVWSLETVMLVNLVSKIIQDKLTNAQFHFEIESFIALNDDSVDKLNETSNRALQNMSRV